MVKVDIGINEIVGLAEAGRIDEKQFKKFLKTATKEEMEEFIISEALGNNSSDENKEEDIEEDNDDDDVI